MRFIKEKTAGLVHTRTLVLVSILVAPILIYVIAGGVATWRVGWFPWLWWMAPVFWLIAWIVSRLWPMSSGDELQHLHPVHWTPRDQDALEIVRRYQSDVPSYSTEQLTNPQFYFDQAQAIANDLARHYRPKATDPIADRTLPELLAACRLVADDLEDLVLSSIPGSRMLTIKQWRKLGEAPEFVRQATKAFWATRILLNPLNLAHWGTSRLTTEKVAEGLQMELLGNLYVRFIRQLGYYLIEMNSGRLRGGAKAYRSAFEQLRNQPQEVLKPKTPASLEPAVVIAKTAGLSPASAAHLPLEIASQDSETTALVKPLQIQIAVVGLRGVGKTTLIQLLLEEESYWDSNPKAASASVFTNGEIGNRSKKGELTNQRTAFSPTKSFLSLSWKSYEDGTLVSLVDSPGFKPHATGRKLNHSIEYLVRNAHAILLVLSCSEEGWDSAKELLERTRNSFRMKENLKPPKVIAVLSCLSDSTQNESVEGLSAAETSSPGSIAKDHARLQFRDQWVERVKKHFDDLIDDFVLEPLEPGQSQVANFKKSLLTTLNRHHEAARSSAVLAVYEESLSRGKYRILFQQAKSSGKRLLSNWFHKGKVE
jgi:uncharacterized protein